MLSSLVRKVLRFGLLNKTPANTSPTHQACYMSHPPRPWLNLTIFGEENRLRCSSLWNFLHNPPSFPLYRSIFINTQLSETLRLYLPVNVRNQVSQSYFGNSKITVLCILIFGFSYKMGRQKLLDCIIASIPCLYPNVYFVVDIILICMFCLKVFEFCHIFKRFIINHYIASSLPSSDG